MPNGPVIKCVAGRNLQMKRGTAPILLFAYIVRKLMQYISHRFLITSSCQWVLAKSKQGHFDFWLCVLAGSALILGYLKSNDKFRQGFRLTFFSFFLNIPVFFKRSSDGLLNILEKKNLKMTPELPAHRNFKFFVTVVQIFFI